MYVDTPFDDVVVIMEVSSSNTSPNARITEACSVEDLSNDQFLQIFKISRQVFMYLHEEIKQCFKSPRVNAVTPLTRLTCCLQVLSNQLNQKILRQNISICPPVSQPSVSRSVEMILTAFENKICPAWIKFPSTSEAKAQCTEKFREKAGLTNVIGCVVCISVGVLSFINNQQRFGNANGVQSINVQLVCDYDMRILSVDPRYPGGVPAVDIWSVSAEKEELEHCYHNGTKHCLLASSDYPIEPWLITPFHIDDSSTDEQINFNRQHARAMNRLTQCLSILQQKFEILQSARYPPEKMTKILNACCALYNIALENGCFNELITNSGTFDDGEYVDESISQEHSLNDDPKSNPYYKFGCQVRDDMMRDMVAYLHDE